MCERRTVHVFLGAPPPSSASAGGGRGEERRPDEWRHLELTWREGRLSPVTGLEEAEDGLLEELSKRENKDTSGCLIQAADPTTEAKISLNAVEGDLRPANGFLRREEEELNSGQCSASVLEYLNSCFPPAQPEPLKPEPPLRSQQWSLPDVAPLSSRTQYLTTWTLSQALILRGSSAVHSTTSPEKPPPAQPPPKEPQTPPSVSSGTPELFGLAELLGQPRPTLSKVEEGGVVVEATMDGVLCSQEAEQQESRSPRGSPPQPPGVKKARLLENIRAKEPNNPPAGLQGPTTLLVQCDKQGFQLSVLVAVIHPCHLKEVKVKSGRARGTCVPLASIVVTDQSGVEMKVVLWRRAAFWALTVSPGDVLLITGLQVNEDRWRGETVLQSTFTSKLLNLGQVTASASPPAPRHVDAHSLRSLCIFLRERRPLLVSLNLCPPQDMSRLPYASLRSLRVNTLVHALLRVENSHIGTAWRSEADSRFRSAVQLQAILTVEQPHGQQGALLLWGAAVDWLPRFNRDRAAVWDFRYLLVREGLTSDLAELHSTSWSSARPLDPSDRRAQDFFLKRSCGGLELDLDTLLSQKYSGDAELRVQVDAFHFQDSAPSQNAPQVVLDSSTPLDGILAALSGDITYTGCGRCSTELDTDANGIYRPCYRCLPNTTVRRYYRPGVLTVSGRGGRQVCVQVPPVPLQEILEAPPHKLSRSSAPGSEVKFVQVAAERIRMLLCLPRKTFVLTVRSDCLCDENSAPLSRDLTLLELRLTDDKSKTV
ncbi:shieldin complex subunit 2 isoform 2-T3 [Spinachia spinachia]